MRFTKLHVLLLLLKGGIVKLSCFFQNNLHKYVIEHIIYRLSYSNKPEKNKPDNFTTSMFIKFSFVLLTGTAQVIFLNSRPWYIVSIYPQIPNRHLTQFKVIFPLSTFSHLLLGQHHPDACTGQKPYNHLDLSFSAKS